MAVKMMGTPKHISGPSAGAGQLPHKGPGTAGMKKVNRFGGLEVPKGTTSGSAPKGMKTYMGR